MTTTTFLKQEQTAAEVAGENARLYYDIQHLNRYSPDVYKLFEEAFRTFRHASISRNPASFLALMRRGRAFFQDR